MATIIKLVVLLLLLGSPAWSQGKDNQDVRALITALSPEQNVLLTSFFRTLIQNSFSGYVLYGDKPICIEAHPLLNESGALSGVNPQTPILIKGMELWQKLEVSANNKNYILLIFDPEESECRHLVCINRKAFLQTVNENLPLFRYVLGPTLTAESLLEALLESKNRFYEVLKNDNVLLGILLGYGKQNALYVSRKEQISYSFSSERKEDFPYISKKTRHFWQTFPKAQQLRPSLGFVSLTEERDTLKKKVTVSRNLKPFDSFAIPYFGCDPNSEESKTLLSLYEKNRLEISKIVKEDEFLDKTLTRLLTTTTNTIEIPSIPSSRPLNLPEHKSEIIHKLTTLIHQEMRNEKYFQESFKKAFFEGITAREKGKKPIALPEQAWELYQIEKELEQSENLEKSNAYFSLLVSRKDLTPLIPNKVYFKLLKQGQGTPLSSKIKNASFHFSFHLPDENTSEMGTVQKEKVEYLIPGIARALVGMKRGEERELHIHPEYGYGNDSYFSPNATLIAQVQLIDFEEGETEAFFASPLTLEKKNHKELLKKYEKLKSDEFYANGMNFWDCLKKRKDFIDFKTFKHFFLDEAQNPAFISNEESRKFLTDLHWFILSSELKDTGE